MIEFSHDDSVNASYVRKRAEDTGFVNRTRGTNGYFPKIEINIDYDENDNPIGVEILW